MRQFKLYDGTATPRAGNSLLKTLRNISKIRNEKVQVSPMPGTVNFNNYYLVKRTSNKLKINGIINAELLAQRLENEYNKYNNDYINKIILVDDDIRTRRTNWCIGVVSSLEYPSGKTINYLVVSTYRIGNDNHLSDSIAHEMGHLFGAPSEDRSNTENYLGTHCINNLCVMQQKVTVDDQKLYADLRARMKAPMYCKQCEVNIRKKNNGNHN